MRFKLTFQKFVGSPEGFVAIYDTYNPHREICFSDNDDQSIRNGIKHFYIQDTIDLRIDENKRDQFVSCKMDELPKEDLSFKEVKEID